MPLPKIDFGNIQLPKIKLGGIKFAADEKEETQDRAMPTRYTEPLPPIGGIPAKYQYAAELAKALKCEKGMRYDCIVSGDFVFGDFIGAYLFENKVKAERMRVSTLSVNEKNIEVFERLMRRNIIHRLDFILSSYFFAHERHKLMREIYAKLDNFGARFDIAIAGIHTKIVQFETGGGEKIVIHGSANLRSSGNVEQFTIEDNPTLYDFYMREFDKVMERFSIIKKEIRNKELWELLNNDK